MADLKIPSLPVVSTGNRQLDKWLAEVNQIIRVREGVGDPLDRLVTMRDIRDSNIGLVTVQGQPQPRYIGVAIPPLPGGVQVKQIDYTPPPAITGLAASGALQNIIVSWNLPLNENYAFAEVFRADSDSIGAAEKIGTSSGTVYADPIGESEATRYYWARQVSEAGVAGPFNATAGVSAETGQIGATDIGPNSITTGMIQTNAVTADKIIAAAVTAAKIDTNAVTADKIQANAITSSKIAADQVDATHMAASSITASNAALANLAVTEAKIASLAVSTIKIQNQAVTIPVQAYSASNSVFSTGWAQMQSAAITSSGAPIQILFTCALAISAQSGGTRGEIVYLRIKRDSTVIWGPQIIGITDRYGATSYNSNYLPVAVGIQETPGSGVTVYTADLSATVGSTFSGANSRSIVLLEVKK